MKRIEQIMEHSIYKEKQNRIDELEQERIYCKHGLEHALDVARIMYIHVLKEKLSFDQEIIYATALLHDIGRCDQYEREVLHHIASAQLAKQILLDCDFDSEEITLITSAISSHRKDSGQKGSLDALLYDADKMSRPCYRCCAVESCKWSKEKRNQGIIY